MSLKVFWFRVKPAISQLIHHQDLESCTMARQGPRLTLKKVTSISKWVGEHDYAGPLKNF